MWNDNPEKMADNPLVFTLKKDAPTFDLAEGRDRFEQWKMKWDAFMDTSGLSNLTEGTGDADARRIRGERILRLKKSALITALSEETLLTVSNMGAGTMDSAEAIVTALERRIGGTTNSIVRAFELFSGRRHEGEDVESFAIAVRDKASKCGYLLWCCRPHHEGRLHNHL